MTDTSFSHPSRLQYPNKSKTLTLFERLKPTDALLIRMLLVIGVLLRLRQYLFNRSLWLDECLLSLNLISRSLGELLKPLNYHQGAPLGFLVLEKGVLHLFGTGEMALRSVPLLSGIASLFLFAEVAKRFLTTKAVPIAVGLFAISGPLIYYSSEAKQYSTDVAVVLALLLLADSIIRTETRPVQALLFSFAAAISIWFSQPAAFVVAGIGVTWLWVAIREPNKKDLTGPLAFGIITAASFVVSFFLSLRKLSQDEWLLGYWNGAFLPMPPFSLAAIRWLITTWLNIWETPVGLTFVGIATAASIVGMKEMFREHLRNLFLLTLPIVLALIASGFHRYPFRGRLLLFAVPSLLLLVAAGLSAIRRHTSEAVPWLGALLIGLLFFVPAEDALHYLSKPAGVEEIRPALQYVQQHRQAGDTLYCYYDAEPALKYYSSQGVIQPMPAIIGIESRQNWAAYLQDLNHLQGKERIWILFSHIYRGGGVDEERFFLSHLDQIGKRKAEMRATGASVYLYDFSEPVNRDFSKP